MHIRIAVTDQRLDLKYCRISIRVNQLIAPGKTSPAGHDIAINIGISVYHVGGEDSGPLLKNADAAMYYAKECGCLPRFQISKKSSSILFYIICPLDPFP